MRAWSGSSPRTATDSSETLDDREIFFHRNSVLNGEFKHLAVGTEVSFVEELGEKGPQASTVKLVGRHQDPTFLTDRGLGSLTARSYGERPSGRILDA